MQRLLGKQLASKHPALLSPSSKLSFNATTLQCGLPSGSVGLAW